MQPSLYQLMVMYIQYSIFECTLSVPSTLIRPSCPMQHCQNNYACVSEGAGSIFLYIIATICMLGANSDEVLRDRVGATQLGCTEAMLT